MAQLLKLYRVLSILFRCIDVREDPYRSKIKKITKILEDVESHEAEIESLVEEAGLILKSIIKEGRLLAASANLFDNAIREARLKMNFRSKTLAEAETIIKELRQKASVFQWMSRAVRVAGVGISWYFFYERYKNDTISPSTALGCSVLVAFLILSMFPENAYKLTESVEDLLVRYQLSFDNLKHLEELMDSTQSFKDGLNNSN